jgi:hypothetical protein
MSEQVAEAAPGATQAGPLSRLVERVEARFEPGISAAEHVAAMVAGDVKAIAKNHAGLFSVVADALQLIEFIDPADAAAIKAAEALVTKLFTMAGNAAAVGQASLKPSS